MFKVHYCYSSLEKNYIYCVKQFDFNLNIWLMYCTIFSLEEGFDIIEIKNKNFQKKTNLSLHDLESLIPSNKFSTVVSC